MADLHGFEVVIEAGASVPRKVLRGAWKSAECPDGGDTGRIPEFLDIPDDTGPVSFGDYEVEDGQVQLPQDELDASYVADLGAALKFGLHMQVEVKDPPVPSAGFFEMTADVQADVPIVKHPDSMDVGLMLDSLPRASVDTTLTSGDPLASKLDMLLPEYVHARYEDGTIPHTINRTDEEWKDPVAGFVTLATVDVFAEIFDDASDPAHRIEVGLPDPSTIEISLPIYLRISNIRPTAAGAAFLPPEGLEDPMGIETRLSIQAPFDSPPGLYRARLDEATVTVGPLAPVGADVAGDTLEGDNYTTNKDRLPQLDDLLVSGLEDEGAQLAAGIGPIEIDVPTIGEIETAIGDFFHADLEARGFIFIWNPEAAGDTFDADDATVKVLPDALVIALNASDGADVDAMSNFIPTDREFAIGLDGAAVRQIIDESRADNGFADSDLPKRMDADGDEVDLNELDIFLIGGAIRMEGEVTVIDAVLGSIDVDAGFWVDVGLHWEPDADLNAAGGQEMKHDILDSDVDPEESVLLWVITAILVVITLGAGSVLLAVIVVVVALIVRAIVENIGGDLLVDEATDALNGITAWPTELSNIGRVRAVFHDPIVIEANGLVMAGTMEVISTCETTTVMAADSGSAYAVDAASALMLAAQNTHGTASYQWLAGDGSALVDAQSTSHVYAESGLYVAKHALTINQTGGATSRHFALVDVRNVPPSVDAGEDLTVEEGEVVTLVGRFEDVEYPDTHESIWNFGDSQTPQPGTIQETNDPPQAAGTSTVQHAWCDNGTYTVTLRVRDRNGGMAADTRTVTVLNVPPVVDAGPDLYAYPCTVITVTGRFEDAGWCDTHGGAWSFGDCSPPQAALVEEVNEPPAARGTVTASHVYRQCGTYHALCIVTDDDGGVGQDAAVIEVVDVRNKDFEDGYHKRALGGVANHWEPYARRAATPESRPAAGAVGEVFHCEECIVHGGQRAQRIRARQHVRAGIYQHVGANPGWDYQVTVWYAIDEVVEGTARLGLDPLGGTDPDAPGVLWNDGRRQGRWAQLVGRVTARSRRLTLFLEAEGTERLGGDVCFDDVALVPIQPFCSEEPEEERPRQTCVDFADAAPDTPLPAVYEKGGFIFHAQDKQPLRVVAWGVPAGRRKLELRAGGLVIALPFVAGWARVKVASYGGRPVVVTAQDAGGSVVDRATAPTAPEALHAVVVQGSGIVRLTLRGGRGEALLFEVCARRASRQGGRKKPRRTQPRGAEG